MKILIPASLASTRIPSKPLVLLGKNSLVEWTASHAGPDAIVVTDSDAVQKAVPRSRFVQTAVNGTDRVWQAVREAPYLDDIIVNWQVDEPFIELKEVLSAADRLANQDRFDIATLVCNLSPEKAEDPNTVKVAVDRGRAMWFSRSDLACAKEHVGIYLFKQHVLGVCAEAPVSGPARGECLEQLDWLCYGQEIMTHDIGKIDHLSINSHADLAAARLRVEAIV